MTKIRFLAIFFSLTAHCTWAQQQNSFQGYYKDGFYDFEDLLKIKKSNYETASKSRNENTDLNDNEQPKTEVNIYPNPAANLLNVSYNLDQKNPYTLYVYDIVGKQLSSHPLNRDNNVIDLTGLPHGIYVIKVKGKHEEIVKRLEIQ